MSCCFFFKSNQVSILSAWSIQSLRHGGDSTGYPLSCLVGLKVYGLSMWLKGKMEISNCMECLWYAEHLAVGEMLCVAAKVLERCWYNLISLPLKITLFFSLAFFSMASFRGKLNKQHMISLGGSLSCPLGLRALWILSYSMGESSGLSSKSLKMAEAVCSRGFWSVGSGTPLIRLLWWRPWLSRSSMCLWSSIVCDRCMSEFFCTCLMVSAWRAEACSTDPTLLAIDCMSALRSVIAAASEDWMSVATICRSERLRFYAGCILLCAATDWAPERSDGLPCCSEPEAVGPSPAETLNIAGMLPGGCELGSFKLRVAEELRSSFPIAEMWYFVIF